MLNRGYDGVPIASTLLLACALLIAQTGCTDDSPPEPPKVRSIIDLTQALADAGVDAAWSGQAVNSAIPIAGHDYLVGLASIQVFEFETLADRQIVSDAIDRQGAIAGVSLADWIGRPNIWTAGRLIVLYSGLDGGTVLLISGLLGDPLTVEAPVVDDPYPPAVLAAMGALAERLGSAPERLEVVRYEAVEWANSCLGLPQPDEACSEAITPGWLIILKAETREYEIHSDELGQAVREK